MIKLVDKIPSGITPSCAAAVRAISLFNAYNGYNIALFWSQTNDNGTTAFISRMDGDITVFATDTADLYEIAQFIKTVCASSVLSNVPLPLKGEVAVTQLTASGEVFCDYTCSLSTAYEIMSTCFAMPDFDVWYADMSHRVRHGAAVVRCSDASAACGLIANGSALVVGLCTMPDSRKGGKATEVLNQLKQLGCNLFVLAEDEIVRFYVNRNFEISGKHYIYNGDV